MTLPTNEKKHRKSRLQRITLEEITRQPNKVARRKVLSTKVAFRYCPEKIEKREFGSRSPCGKWLQTHKLPKGFSTSLNRVLNEFKAQGIVELVRGTPLIREEKMNGVVVIREIIRRYSSHGKVTVVIHRDSSLYKKQGEN